MFKRTSSLIVATTLISGAAVGVVAVGAGSASAAIPRTVYCYKNPGNDNGQRLELRFADNQRSGGISTTSGALTATLQNWNGSSYVGSGVSRTLVDSIGYRTGDASNLCTNLANSFFLGGQLDGFRIGTFG